MVGKAKNGGSETGKYPLCQEEMTMPVYLSDVQYSHPPKEGPLPPLEGWLYTLH